MVRAMPRRSSRSASRRPSGKPRKVRSVTPTWAAAAVCSRRRTAAISCTRQRPVRASRLAVGGDAVGHLHTGRGPDRDRTGGGEVHVVGVGGHHQDPLDTLDAGTHGHRLGEMTIRHTDLLDQVVSRAEPVRRGGPGRRVGESR